MLGIWLKCVNVCINFLNLDLLKYEPVIFLTNMQDVSRLTQCYFFVRLVVFFGLMPCTLEALTVIKTFCL